MAVAICFTIISGHGSLQHVTNIAVKESEEWYTFIYFTSKIAVFTGSGTKAGFTLGA